MGRPCDGCVEANNEIMSLCRILTNNQIKLDKHAERVAELEAAANAIILNARGRSGGSVYMINKDEWIAFKSTVNQTPAKVLADD